MNGGTGGVKERQPSNQFTLEEGYQITSTLRPTNNRAKINSRLSHSLSDDHEEAYDVIESLQSER
jgi:hypothetical protein